MRPWRSRSRLQTPTTLEEKGAKKHGTPVSGSPGRRPASNRRNWLCLRTLRDCEILAASRRAEAFEACCSSPQGTASPPE